MKINQPDYDRLKALVIIACSPYGGIDATFRVLGTKYEGRPATNRSAMIRWDIFHTCCRLDKHLLQHLYDYLNDNHIDTAMRHITDTK